MYYEQPPTGGILNKCIKQDKLKEGYKEERQWLRLLLK